MIMASHHHIWKKFGKWCRLIILIHRGGEFVCKDILSQKMGIKDTTDGAEIYRKLKPYEKKIKTMAIDQQKALLPDNEVTDTIKMDLSLITCIIQILDTTQNYPLIAELRLKRIELFHLAECKRDLTEQLFNEHWDKISQSLTNLQYNIDLMKELKTEDPLSQEHEKTLKDITHNMKGSTELSWVSTSVIYLI